jgi:hypothetical protein
MFNRAKYHPHRTKQMEDAMKIFSKWLKKYPKSKVKEDKLYPWLAFTTIIEYEKIAKTHDIYKDNTDINFFKILKKNDGKASKLQYIPIKSTNPSGQDYWSYRIELINYTLNQIKKTKNPLYYSEGKYKGLPTKQHLLLILHGYSPDKKLYNIK